MPQRGPFHVGGPLSSRLFIQKAQKTFKGQNVDQSIIPFKLVKKGIGFSIFTVFKNKTAAFSVVPIELVHLDLIKMGSHSFDVNFSCSAI